MDTIDNPKNNEYNKKLPEKFEKLTKTATIAKNKNLVIHVPQKDGSVYLYTNDYTNPIVNFIEDATFEEIQKWLNIFLRFTHGGNMCDQYLGSGFIGSVKRNAFGPTYTLHYDNNVDVTIPIVIKQTNVENELATIIIDNDLYIYNSRGINVEAIIMYFMKPLIMLKLSPHLPLIIEHGKCMENENQPVDRIVAEMHGLGEEIYMHLKGFYESPMWRPNPIYDPENPFIVTTFTTIADMCLYINIKSGANDEMILPNKVTCNVIELLDYMAISYLVTYDLMTKFNIHLLDMHPDNIFIHWLNKNSFMADQYIGNTKYIFYKVGDVFYKIKTFGLLLKLGDVGACIIHPKKDLYIVGQVYDIETTYPIIKTLVNTTKCHDFFNNFYSLKTVIYRELAAHAINNSAPYDEMNWTGITQEQFNQMLNPEQMLHKFFSKYAVDKIDETDDYLVF